jgi:hypothetical protein
VNSIKAASGELNVLSLTISVQGEDVETSEIEKVSQSLDILKESGLFEDGIMGIERGSAADNLHMQIMLQGRFLRSTRKRKSDSDSTHQEVLKAFFNRQQCFARSWYCFVRVHELSSDITWESMAGCDVVMLESP